MGLHRHAEVDLANQVINHSIRQQLGEYPSLANQACQIVGELHDNVPAHSGGAGFSMAQFYAAAGLLEIAVCDSDRGLLRNVRKIDPTVRSHSDAITWCMTRGNTTAGDPDEWAQMLRENSFHNPYGNQTATRTSDNHHAGLGLWKLEQIVRAARGCLAVWSGNTRFVIADGQGRCERASDWCGVAVALQLPIAGDLALAGQSDLKRLESLAEQLNL